MRPDDHIIDPRKLAADPDFKAPDIVGTVAGWRAWSVQFKLPQFGLPPKLRSVTAHSFYWTPRQKAMAECDTCRENVPGETCGCGFYSAKSLEHLMSMSYHWYNEEESGCVRVVGIVANWGKVIEGSQGWRSQYSYPTQLFVPFEAHHLLKPLCTTYGIKGKLMNTLSPELRRGGAI